MRWPAAAARPLLAVCFFLAIAVAIGFLVGQRLFGVEPGFGPRTRRETRMLAFGTTITSAFRVNTTGDAHSLSAWSSAGSAVFADAKTSAGAPCWICAASMFDPPNE